MFFNSNLFKKTVNIAILLVLFVFTTACSYNHYLGKQYESEGRFEESYEYYLQAYSEKNFMSSYLKDIERVKIKLANDLEERYFLAIDNKLYKNAYFLLNKILALTPDNQRIKNEKLKWYRVLLIGNLLLENILENRAKHFDKVNLLLEFQSPTPQQSLRANIDTASGIFIAEDFVYKPAFGLLGFYAINAIVIDHVTYEASFKLQTQKASSAEKDKNVPVNLNAIRSFINLVDLKNILHSQSNGTLEWENYNTSGSVINFIKNSSYLSVNDPDDWLIPLNAINYQTKLVKNDILISTESKSIDFLPGEIFISKQDRLFLLNFGNLTIKRFSDLGEWGIKRLPTNEQYIDKLEQLFNNILYKNFKEYNGAVLSYKKSG